MTEALKVELKAFTKEKIMTLCKEVGEKFGREVVDFDCSVYVKATLPSTPEEENHNSLNSYAATFLPNSKAGKLFINSIFMCTADDIWALYELLRDFEERAEEVKHEAGNA